MGDQSLTPAGREYMARIHRMSDPKPPRKVSLSDMSEQEARDAGTRAFPREYQLPTTDDLIGDEHQ